MAALCFVVVLLREREPCAHQRVVEIVVGVQARRACEGRQDVGDVHQSGPLRLSLPVRLPPPLLLLDLPAGDKGVRFDPAFVQPEFAAAVRALRSCPERIRKARMLTVVGRRDDERVVDEIQAVERV